MKLGIAAVGICVVSLLASLVFNVPSWVNIVGLVAGVVGLVLLGRAKKDGGV